MACSRLRVPVAAVDACVRAAMERLRIPGLSLAIAAGGDLLYAGGYGLRSISYGVAPDAQTMYKIASISKQFTAAMVLRLVERGRLSLDDPIGRYIPYVRNGAAIAIRQMLGHVSGIPNYSDELDFDQRCRTRATPDEVAMSAMDREVVFRPGDEWQYCNTNYVLLARLVELLNDDRYSDVLAREILAPIGLARTGVDDRPLIRADAAEGYSTYCLGPFEYARAWDPSWEFGTGALYSTAVDLARWNHALRTGGIVKSETYALMATQGILNDGTATGYGFGLGVADASGIKEVFHGGNLPGFMLESATYPDLDLDIVVLTNQDVASLEHAFIRPLLALVLGRPELGGPAVRERPVKPKCEPPPPEAWIPAAREGRIDELGLTASFRRFLTRDHRAELLALARFGEVRKVTLLGASCSDPVNEFAYRVDFAEGTLLATLAVRHDSGEIDLLNFYPDDRH